MCTWKITGEDDRLDYCPDHAQKTLIYARTYTIGENYKHSGTNQLIFNLKRRTTASQGALYHKKEAIRQFADEASVFLSRHEKSRQLCLVPMPSSKIASHPEYDDRIEQVAERVSLRLRSRATHLLMLEAITNRQPSHLGGSRNEVGASMKINDAAIEKYDPSSVIVIIDDVLTSGAHFSAAFKHIRSRLPNAEIVGLFWAKAQDPNFTTPSEGTFLSEDLIDF